MLARMRMLQMMFQLALARRQQLLTSYLFCDLLPAARLPWTANVLRRGQAVPTIATPVKSKSLLMSVVSAKYALNND